MLRKCQSVRCSADMVSTRYASCWHPLAKSVTMRPRESLRLVTEAHRHFRKFVLSVESASCKGWVQPLQSATRIKACASQMPFRAQWR